MIGYFCLLALILTFFLWISKDIFSRPCVFLITLKFPQKKLNFNIYHFERVDSFSLSLFGHFLDLLRFFKNYLKNFWIFHDADKKRKERWREKRGGKDPKIFDENQFFQSTRGETQGRELKLFNNASVLLELRRFLLSPNFRPNHWNDLTEILHTNCLFCFRGCIKFWNWYLNWIAKIFENFRWSQKNSSRFLQSHFLIASYLKNGWTEPQCIPKQILLCFISFLFVAINHFVFKQK